MALNYDCININARDAYGRTPLCEACDTGLHVTNVKIIKSLLSNGGDVNATDHHGAAAYDLSMDNEIKQLLCHHGDVPRHN